MDFDASYAWGLFIKSLLAARVTLQITFVSMFLGTIIGFIVSNIRLKNIRVFSQLCQLYVSFIRGTPLMIQIYVIYYLVPRLLSGVFEALAVPLNVYDIDPMGYAYLVFSLHVGAIISEVFRAALQTVDIGQTEAALSIGMNRFQTFFRIVFPQSIVVALPNVCNCFVSVLKGTSLVFAMTVMDITATAKVEVNKTYKFLEGYLAILLIYIIICYISEKIFKLIEKKLGKYKFA